ncbi:MAG: NEAT domain-containing protein, partial [Ruminococcus sp.]|nr:NEAT domain-containing protein [Ruminococcus sp.]
GENSAAIVASAEGTTVDFPETKPTSTLNARETATYSVPVYIYTSDYEGESMSNASINHTAVLKIEDGKKYITLKFSPIVLNGLRGHIQKFYYYNMSANEYTENRVGGNGAANNEFKTEVTGDNVTYGYDDLSEFSGDESSFAKYVSTVTFELPTNESDVVCRFKVDAMGDTEQDAVIVFDWDNTVADTARFLEAKLEEAKAINNDDGKYTASSFTLLQNQFATAENRLTGANLYSPSLHRQSINNINNALINLTLVDDKERLPDGIYNIPFAMYETESAEYETYYDKTTDSTASVKRRLPTDTKVPIMETIFGNTAVVESRNGIYTITLNQEKEDDNYYLAGLTVVTGCAASLNKLKFNYESTMIDYFGKNVQNMSPNSSVTFTLAKNFEGKDILVRVNGWDKNTEQKVVKVADSAALSFDWSNAVKTADLEIDKTELEDNIGYADMRLSGDMSAYTEDSVKAVQSAYDEAVKVNENSQIQAEINEALANLKSAMSGLKTYKTALQEKVDEVKAVDTAEYTEVSAKALADEIAKAEELLAQDEPAKDELAAEIAALDSAVAALEKKPVPGPRLEDGKYTVQAEMIKLDKKDHSMANNAIDHTLEIQVKDGEYYATVTFKGMSVMDQTGYLRSLGYYDAGYTFNQYGVPQGTVIPAEVISTYDVVDQYNDKNSPYPEKLRFKLVDKTDAEFVPLQVFVPVMEAISQGSGTQNVLMKIDWSSVKKVEEPKRLNGDVNGSGKVDVKDAMKIIAFVKKTAKPKTDDEFKYADVNHDGVINVKDAMLVIAHIKGTKKLSD